MTVVRGRISPGDLSTDIFVVVYFTESVSSSEASWARKQDEEEILEGERL